MKPHDMRVLVKKLLALVLLLNARLDATNKHTEITKKSVEEVMDYVKRKD